MNLLIRKMTLTDLEQVIAIDQASFSLPWPERSFRFELTDNTASRSWVAELHGRIVGMVVLWLLVDEAHIATFATHPDFRQRGIGKRLLVHALAAVRAEGAHRSFLEVRAANTLAQEMYRTRLLRKCIVNLGLWKRDVARITIRIMVRTRS